MVGNDVSLRCYPETLDSPCKVWQLQRWEKNRLKTVSVPQSQILAGVKTFGLVGLWGRFIYVFGGKKKIKIFLEIF